MRAEALLDRALVGGSTRRSVDRRAGLVEHGRAAVALLDDRRRAQLAAARHGVQLEALGRRSARAAASPVRPGQQRHEHGGVAERAGGARDVEALAAGRHDDAVEAQHLAGAQLARWRACGPS